MSKKEEIEKGILDPQRIWKNKRTMFTETWHWIHMKRKGAGIKLSTCFAQSIVKSCYIINHQSMLPANYHFGQRLRRDILSNTKIAQAAFQMWIQTISICFNCFFFFTSFIAIWGFSLLVAAYETDKIVCYARHNDRDAMVVAFYFEQNYLLVFCWTVIIWLLRKELQRSEKHLMRLSARYCYFIVFFFLL